MTTTLLTRPGSYSVSCLNCGAVFQPIVESPLWKEAKARIQGGAMDAMPILGTECGCVEKQRRPDAPFRVYGYTDDCRDFDNTFDTALSAIRSYIRRSKSGCTVFINGLPRQLDDRVQQRAW